MKARLIETCQIAPDVCHFTFEVDDVEVLTFQPGQFVSFMETLDGREITRPYTIASVPCGRRFELCLNLVKEGIFSPYLFSMQPGDTVQMSAPLGYFVLRKTGRDAILVATGTGIAPFRSMVDFHLKLGDTRPITLIFGVRYEDTILYRAEFDALAKRYPNFRFWPTLSRPGSGWTGRTGHVQRHIAEALGERRDVEVYICGLKAMVDDVRAMLKDLGLDRKQIVYEKYD